MLGEFRRLLETRGLFQAVTADVKVSEDQITKAFGERKDQLAVPERRHLRHLVVTTEDEAKKALARMKGREAFTAVATSVSLDASTKDQGGDLGIVVQAQLDPAFGAAAFAVAKGSTFGPVMTKNGWHVGLVEDITTGHAVTLAEVHDSLRDTLVAEAGLAEWRTYLGGRIKQRRRLLRRRVPARRPEGAAARHHAQHPNAVLRPDAARHAGPARRPSR